MKLFKQVLDFYIRSSLHVALCFVALFHVTGFYAGFKLNYHATILVFCAVVSSYNLMKYGVLLLQKRQFRYRVPIVVLTGFCALLLLFLSLQETLHAQLVLGFSAVLCLLYMLPLYRKHGLRFFPVMKVVIVALCWVLLLVYYPAVSIYNSGFALSFEEFFNQQLFLALAAQLFLIILALCIPFEIRDLKYDDVALHTLPQLVGIKISKLFGIGLLALVPALEFVFKQDGLMRHVEVYAILIITALAIWICDRFKSDYFVSLFVEAVPVLWLVLYFIL